jgi:4-azaleucine resistance transporter AzlC
MSAIHGNDGPDPGEDPCYRTSAGEAWEGFVDIAPAAIAAVPIGLLFGALAAAKGLSIAEVSLMSALVCAGGAQFAIIELWSYPVPVGTIVASTALINLRHVLMGTSIGPKTGAFRLWQKVLTFYALVDETWAFAERRAGARRLTPAYFGAMGATLWINWVTCSTLGAAAGSFLGDPKAIGADFAFTALFIGIVAALWRGRATTIPVMAAAMTGAVAYRFFGTPWHVVAGAAAGIAAAALAWQPVRAR